MGAHFLKYGDGESLFRAIDIDPGAEPLAQSFGEDGAIFKVDRLGDKTRGFNIFASCRGPNDDQFAAHARSQIMRMMATNDNAELRFPTAEEQYKLDQAIFDTMKLPRAMQGLSTIAYHCPVELRMKMQRWIHERGTTKAGMYAHLMDATDDAIGTLTTRVAAFNLQGVKDDPVALPIIQAELFFRIKRSFEDEALRTVPKHLDIDEAHVPLAIPSFAQEVETFVRTCGKWRASIAFWSQSPREYGKLESWPALRSAASTFIFLADPSMDEALYRQVFLLTPGECEAIRRLTPKREAYIIQRDIGVSKKVILQVEPEQYVIATSQPREATIRRENFERYGFKGGLQRTIEALGLSDESGAGHPAETPMLDPSKEVA
jgi:type IV secretion system protein VirB4